MPLLPYFESVYSGNDRSESVVLLNQGVPRFDLANPVPTVPIKTTLLQFKVRKHA